MSAGCAAGKLRVGDILIAIDEVPIGEDGDIALSGRQHEGLEYLFTRKICGDTVKVTVLRSQPLSSAPITAQPKKDDAAGAALVSSTDRGVLLQFAPKGAPKSISIRCQDTFPSWSYCLIDVARFLLPTSDPESCPLAFI